MGDDAFERAMAENPRRSAVMAAAWQSFSTPGPVATSDGSSAGRDERLTPEAAPK